MVLVELNWLADAELLGRIGRQALVPVLEGLAPLLVQAGAALPDPGLADALFFPKLAAVLRAHPVKVAVCLASFHAASSAAQTQPPAFARGAPLPASDPADYALRRDGPLWHLVFRDRSAILKHEQGLCYVAELLGHPGEPVQKLSLATKYSAPKSRRGGGIDRQESAASPEAVRREFAQHLQRHLVAPSGRYAGPKARQARGELTGCLLYEPPPGVVWAVSQPG